VLQSLLRQENAAATPRRYHFLYLAGRPVAQLATEAGQPDRWWYLMTDHLGTPIVATDDQGNELWESDFEPFGIDRAAGTTEGVLANEMFLRFPGQWEDETWGAATMGTDMLFNVNRWLAISTGSYTRPDPLGILRPTRLAHPYSYAASNPLLMVDRLGLDALTSNDDVQDCFFCLLKRGGFGFRENEYAAWVTVSNTGEHGCVTEGWVSLQGKAKWPSGLPFPLGSRAFAHTHPTRIDNPSIPEPSLHDIGSSDSIGYPIYTITPGGIYKYDPKTGRVTQEEPANWDDAPKKRCKKRCKDILQ